MLNRIGLVENKNQPISYSSADWTNLCLSSIHSKLNSMDITSKTEVHLDGYRKKTHRKQW